MAGAMVLDPNRRKIKGKRLTVLRFFAVSVSYTIGWYTISSQLDYLKQLFGPAILLQLNIAYYLPSIPLLLITGQFDAWLEQRFGMVRVILTRLVVGLAGCASVSAIFPLAFRMQSLVHAHWFILGACMLNGMCTGIAFSASYQLVSRFANKNVIALGLGYAVSGLMTLVLQLVLQVSHHRSWLKELLMYETVAAITLIGLFSALTILFRKWREIEEIAAHEQGAHAEANEAAFAGDMSVCVDAAQQDAQLPPAPQPHSPPRTPLPPTMPLPVGGLLRRRSLGAPSDTAGRSLTLPCLVGYDFVEPHQSMPMWDDSDAADVVCLPRSLPVASEGGLLHRLSNDLTSGPLGTLFGGAGGGTASAGNSGKSIGGAGGGTASAGSSGKSMRRHSGRSDGLGLAAPLLSTVEDEEAGGDAAADVGCSASARPLGGCAAAAAGEEVGGKQADGSKSGSAGEEGEAGAGEASPLRAIVSAIWPVMASFFLTGVTILTVFPFFTYVESGGMFGDSLPKVLFFTRLFADIAGRLLPRVPALVLTSPYAILVVAGVQFSSMSLYFAYLKAPRQYNCDPVIVAYVIFVWLVCGYVNTLSNIAAPKLVPPHLRSGAAGLMAVAFQVSHFSGLLLAVVLSYALFGGLTGDV